jgi:hypothetical protein
MMDIMVIMASSLHTCFLCCRVDGVCVGMVTTRCWLPSRWGATGAWHATGRWVRWMLAQAHTYPQVQYTTGSLNSLLTSALHKIVLPACSMYILPFNITPHGVCLLLPRQVHATSSVD